MGLLAVAAEAQTPTLPTVLYETGFEAFEGFSPDADLVGQGGWVGYASDLDGEPVGLGGNGILGEPVPGFTGQYAYIGFAAPSDTADSSAWRPVNLRPSGSPLPIVRFRVSFQIEDSTDQAPNFDAFRWSVYNTENHRLFSLDLDNADQSVNVILDGAPGGQPPVIQPTGFTFNHGEPYDLELDINLQRNLWTARINGAVVANAQAVTATGAVRNIGDVDAVWVIREPGAAGDNYMIFDDYSVSVLPLASLPPTVEAVGMLQNGTFLVRVIGEPGVTYRLEATLDFDAWIQVDSGLAQSPSGTVELRDSGAGGLGQRYYRAVSQP